MAMRDEALGPRLFHEPWEEISKSDLLGSLSLRTRVRKNFSNLRDTPLTTQMLQEHTEALKGSRVSPGSSQGWRVPPVPAGAGPHLWNSRCSTCWVVANLW